jgi:hypothetical protein
MAARRIDLENTLNRDPGAAGLAVRPAPSSRPPSVDPSPFSRAVQAEDLLARHQRIATLAYQHAERRGFAPGGALEDWLAAEQEVDQHPL